MIYYSLMQIVVHLKNMTEEDIREMLDKIIIVINRFDSILKEAVEARNDEFNGVMEYYKIKYKK